MITVHRLNKMEIGNVKAFLDVEINNVMIKGLKLCKMPETGELFVSFPATKEKDNSWSDIIYITDVELKMELKNKIIELYNKY